MPSKNLTYCPAFPNSIALRRDIAKANQSRFPLCTRFDSGSRRGEGREANRVSGGQRATREGRETEEAEQARREERGEEAGWHKG